MMCAKKWNVVRENVNLLQSAFHIMSVTVILVGNRLFLTTLIFSIFSLAQSPIVPLTTHVKKLPPLLLRKKSQLTDRSSTRATGPTVEEEPATRHQLSYINVNAETAIITS